MNKKNIQIVVIVLAFGVSGWLIYNNFVKTSAPPPDPLTAIQQMANNSVVPSSGGVSAGAPKATGPMDFSVLRRNGFEFGYPYPRLSTSTDIGLEFNELIKPLPAPPTNIP